MATWTLYKARSQKLADKLVSELVRYGIVKDQLSTTPEKYALDGRKTRKVVIFLAPHKDANEEELLNHCSAFIHGYLAGAKSR